MPADNESCSYKHIKFYFKIGLSQKTTRTSNSTLLLYITDVMHRCSTYSTDISNAHKYQRTETADSRDAARSQHTNSPIALYTELDAECDGRRSTIDSTRPHAPLPGVVNNRLSLADHTRRRWHAAANLSLSRQFRTMLQIKVPLLLAIAQFPWNTALAWETCMPKSSSISVQPFRYNTGVCQRQTDTQIRVHSW